MIAQNNEILTAATKSLFEYNADDIIRQQCQARAEAERHERTMQKMLADKDLTIAEQSNTITEQSYTIAEQNTLLAEKDLRIQELETLLKNQQSTQN